MSQSRAKQLNMRLVVGLLLAAVLLPVGIQLAHVFQVTRSARVMLFRAEKAMGEGKVEEAIRCYRYYVNYEPDDHAVFARLAVLSADRAQASRNRTRELWQAYPLLEQAAQRQPENNEVVRRLVDISLELGRMSAATIYLERLTAASPRDADLQFKLGRCRVNMQDHHRATEAFRRSIALNAANVDAYVELADLLRNLSRPQHADEAIEQMVKANAKSAKAYLERARYAWRAGRRDPALADIDRAAALAPDDLDVLLTAAEFALQRSDYATAQRHLERANRLAPDEDRVDRLLITLRTNLGQTDEAVALLQKVIERNPDDLRSLLSLCDLQLKRSDVPAARATIHRMEKARFSRHIIEYFEGRILMVQGRWREACDELERLRPNARRSADLTKQLNLYLAACYEQLGLPDRQLEIYQRLLSQDPNLLAAHIGLASALFQARKTDRALEEHGKLLRALGAGQFNRYRTLRNNYYQLLAGQVGRLPAAQRDWSKLDRFVASVEQSKDVDPVDAVLMRADLLHRQGKSEQARAMLAEKQQQFPKDVRLRTAQATLMGWQDPVKALAVLGPVGATLGDSVELRLARASLATRLGSQRGLPLLKELETGAEKFSAEEQAKLWQGLGLAYYQLRDRYQTKRFWRRVAEARPDDRQIRMLLFESAREAGDEAGMLEALASFEKLLGRTSAEWKYCEAARLVWQVRSRPLDRQALTTASRYLKQAAALRPMWQSIPCLEAELAVMEGRLDEAIQEFRRAGDIAALNAANLGQYVRLLYVRGRYEEAREHLRKMTAADQPSGLRMVGSELELRAGNLEASLEMAAAAALGSNNPIDHQWYGQLLVRAGRRAEAEVAFRRAVGLGQQIPELWLSLIEHLARSGNRKGALEIMRNAQLLLPEDRTPLILGQSYEALGDFALAEQYYLSGAALYPENFGIVGETANFFVKNGRLRRAVPYLEQLLKLGALRNSVGDRPPLVWARRTLSSILAAEGGYAEQDRALKLIAENAVDGHLSPDDIAVKGSILATRPSRQSQLAAVELLEQSRREAGKLAPNYNLLLAKLYDRTDRPTLAESQMISLARENPADLRTVSSLVQFLVRRQAAAGKIEPWLAILEKLAPTLPITLGSRARLLARSGQTDEAMALLGGMISRPLTSKQFDRARYVAGVFEEIQQDNAARQLLAELAAVDASARLDLAELLARRGSIREALDQCELALKSVPPARVLPVAVGILSASATQAKPEDFRRVEGWFQRPEKQDHSKAVILQLANLLELQSRFPEVTRLYQDFLARSDVSERERAVVYNNLVYLLAVQKKDLRNALEMIDQAISVLGPSPQLRDTRALVLLAAGQSRDAVEELRRVVADSPSGLNYFHLALACASANDLAAAQNAMRLASTNHQLKPEQIPAIERQKYQELLAKLGPL